MSRKNNYTRHHVTIAVHSAADAVNLVQNMVDAGILPNGVGIREKDVMDDQKDALPLIVDNGTDPSPMRLWREGHGIIDDFRFKRDDLKKLGNL